MAAEAGHHAGRAYMAQDGSFHLNGAAFYDASEIDITSTLNGVAVADVAGTAEASKVPVLGADKELAALGDLTIDTSKTLAVTTADKLTVGGVIVPQHEILVSAPIPLHASKVVYNLFVARDAWQITHIDYTPDIAQGGALTATVVKAVTTATPASATTPMHIAGAIDLNAVAHTVQPITLTVTGADLVLAAGNRIGLVLSGAMTTGSGLLTIRGKRV